MKSVVQQNSHDHGRDRDGDEQAYLEGLLVSGNMWSDYSPWIGFNDVQSEGNWVWEDGWTGTYLYWGFLEPNNDQGNENCGQINWQTGTGEWNDADCVLTTIYSGYVCQSR